ncbi:hypothetical protein AB0J52_05960 [Spirillospora sp. NPDC049652]
MGFWKTILGIARNRLIGPPVVVLGLGVAALAFVLTPVTYVSSSLLVLTTPSAGGLEDPNRPGWTTNPLLQFNDGLKTSAAILIQAAGTDEALTKMGAGKGSPTKVVINDGTSDGKVMTASQTGPFIFVQVTSTNEGAVTDIVHNAEQFLRNDLVNRQRTLGAPKQTYLMLTEVVPASSPKAKMTQKWEFSGAAFVAIVGLGFGIAYLGARRRALREAAAETPYDFYYGSTGEAGPLRPARRPGALRSAAGSARSDASAWEGEEAGSPAGNAHPIPLSPNGSGPSEARGSDVPDYGLPLDGDPADTVHDRPSKKPTEPFAAPYPMFGGDPALGSAVAGKRDGIRGPAETPRRKTYEPEPTLEREQTRAQEQARDREAIRAADRSYGHAPTRAHEAVREHEDLPWPEHEKAADDDSGGYDQAASRNTLKSGSAFEREDEQAFGDEQERELGETLGFREALGSEQTRGFAGTFRSDRDVEGDREPWRLGDATRDENGHPGGAPAGGDGDGPSGGGGGSGAGVVDGDDESWRDGETARDKGRQGTAAFEILGAEAADPREREPGGDPEDAPAPRVR